MKRQSSIAALLLCSMLLSLDSWAQSASDALRYSLTNGSGTARSMGAGGAFGALGADFSSASINPAGLGLYQKSEFTLTPSLSFSSSDAEFLGNDFTDKRSNFNVNNVGFVFANKSNGNFRANFAMGVNRIANYNQRFSFEGLNTTNSVTDYYAKLASGTPEADLYLKNTDFASLAYSSYLIDPVVGAENEYMSIIPNGNIQQQQSTNIKGGKDEYLMGMGASYKDKIYFGATLGLPYTHYLVKNTYSETDVNNVDIHNDFESFEELDEINTTGLGVNGKFGLLYRPADFLRLGIAAQTPTNNRFKDDFSASILAKFNGFDPGLQTTAASDLQPFSYTLISPWSFTASAAGIVKKLGFISVDYQWIDYSQMEYRFDDDPFIANQLNENIRNQYQAVSNLRVGAEYAYKMVRARAGFAYQTSPYKDKPEFGTQSISAGLGVREESIYADVAFVHTLNKNTYSPYPDAPMVSLNNRFNNLLFTFGYRF
ncbi:MAG: outer membrane protein transport protein [Chitinophagales bacterium]|nr:outer membrane protein transport protein [Chitinophagales bacterium]